MKAAALLYRDRCERVLSIAHLAPTDAEFAAIVAQLRRFRTLIDADQREGVALAICDLIESVRVERAAGALGLHPWERFEERDDGVYVIAARWLFDECMRSPCGRAIRGRPDQMRQLRRAGIKFLIGEVGLRAAKCRQRDGAKPGSDFEEIVTLAYRFADLRVASVHRDCLAALEQYHVERS